MFGSDWIHQFVCLQLWYPCAIIVDVVIIIILIIAVIVIIIIILLQSPSLS